MRKIISVIIAVILLTGLVLPVQSASKTELESAVNKTAAYMLNTVKNPQVDPVGGEWAVLGLARSGYSVPDSYYENYYRTVEKYVKDKNGALHDVKYTEYSRVILALTAAGYDPRDAAGYDLTAPLEDFDKTVWQGINGPVFALLALDSMNYQNSKRDDYIAEILRRQLNGGGWNLAGGTSASTKNQTGDPDITGMALQALAKYRSKPEVRTAVENGVTFLSETQGANGGYTSWNEENIESSVQVLVALCELGISVNDTRFVRNGKTLVDVILSYQNTDGSFRHTREGGGNDQMATEQALYALVAAKRAAEDKNSLYQMDDIVKRGRFAALPSGRGLPGKNSDVTVMPVIFPGKTFPDIKNHPNQTAVEALVARGIVSGSSETSFDPNATMTRAEFASIVVRALGLPEKTILPFTDVSVSLWYAKPIAAAYYYEIVSGTSATTFDPGGTITRQEAAVMVVRAAKLCGMDISRDGAQIRDTLAQFGDYRATDSWAQSALAFCYDTDILDDGALDINPNEAVKRCEIAEMIYRLLDRADLLQK